MKCARLRNILVSRLNKFLAPVVWSSHVCGQRLRILSPLIGGHLAASFLPSTTYSALVCSELSFHRSMGPQSDSQCQVNRNEPIHGTASAIVDCNCGSSPGRRPSFPTYRSASHPTASPSLALSPSPASNPQVLSLHFFGLLSNHFNRFPLSRLRCRNPSSTTVATASFTSTFDHFDF